MTGAFPRSFLFVPGNHQKLIDSALRSTAEAIVFDLEDSVGDDQKAAARERVRSVLVGQRELETPLFVRINGPETTYFADDVGALAGAPCAGVVIPKVEMAEAVGHIASNVGGIGLVLLIETPRGVLRALDLAEAGGPSLYALAFGAEDLRACMGVDASESESLLTFALPMIAAAAAAVGVPAIDSPELDIADREGLRTRAANARAIGFRAKFAIHPAQLPIIHETFRSTASQRAWAERVTSAYEQGRAEGRGSVRVNDRMVDLATLKRARGILQRNRT